MPANKTLIGRCACVATAAVLCCGTAHGQLLLNENFDSMGPAGTTLPLGWTAGYLGAVGTLNRAAMEPYAGNGLAVTPMPIVISDGSAVPSPNVGTLLSFGTTGSSDRALGNYPRTNPSGDQIMQVEVVNNTGGFLSGISLSYYGEQWRQAQGTAVEKPERLRVLVSTTSATDGFLYLGSAFDFVAPKDAAANIGLDGNLAENRALITGNYLFSSPLPSGSSFFVRWHDWNDDGTTDHFLAIDDIQIAVIPEPGVLSLALLGLGVWVIRRRR